MKDRQITIHLSADELYEVDHYRYCGHTHLSRSEAYRRLILRGAEAFRAEYEKPWGPEDGPRPGSHYRFHQRPYNGLWELWSETPDGGEKIIGVYRTMLDAVRRRDWLVDEP